MTEKLGVLQSKDDKDYYMIRKSQAGFYVMTQSVKHAFQCTQEEAKKYPQFRWVALEEL